MKRAFAYAGGIGLLALAFVAVPRAAAQDPIITPVVVGEAAPIIVKAVTPKPKPAGTLKFRGYVLNANIAQVTAKARGNDMAIQTFPLSGAVAEKMQKIIDKGGYQHGDKITVYYNSETHQVVSFKGKPSRPL